MKTLLPLALAALAGCTAYGPPPPPPPMPMPMPMPAYGTVSSSSSATVQLQLGGSAQINGLNVRPIRIVEDSRCRPTHHCVWAGRLLVLVALDGAGLHDQRTFELGKPQQTPVGWMTLTGGPPLTPGGVLPPIAPLLTFTVTN